MNFYLDGYLRVNVVAGLEVLLQPLRPHVGLRAVTHRTALHTLNAIYNLDKLSLKLRKIGQIGFTS